MELPFLQFQFQCRWPIARPGSPSISFSPPLSNSIGSFFDPKRYQTLMCTAPTEQQQNLVIVAPASRSVRRGRRWEAAAGEAAEHAEPLTLDLTEENVRRVLDEARMELAQIFDVSVGITGRAELVELDGPFVVIRLRGRFWHKRSTVLERLSNYLRQRIPEILEVDVENEKQLDDSPENF